MSHEESVEFARNYVADLLSFFEVNASVEATLHDDIIEVSVPSTEINSLLIGRGAETLRSLQFLVSTVLRNKGARVSRVNLDVADYKRQRADRLAEKTREWVKQVLETGEPRSERLNPADRRIVHHTASEFEGIKTFSEGEGLDRRITITKD